MNKCIIKLSIRIRGYYVSFEENPNTDIDDYRPVMTIYHPKKIGFYIIG